jgi:hypothetical protein
MVQEILDQLQPYIRITRLAWNVLGLAEIVSKDDGRSFPVVYTGQDNAEEVVARDIQTGITFWMRNGDATQEQLDAVRENDPVVRYSIPLRLYCLSGRRVYDSDVPASPRNVSAKYASGDCPRSHTTATPNHWRVPCVHRVGEC